MRVNREKFFKINNIEYIQENIDKYNNGWTFSEIKKWEEFIIEDYKKDLEIYFNLQNENLH